MIDVYQLNSFVMLFQIPGVAQRRVPTLCWWCRLCRFFWHCKLRLIRNEEWPTKRKISFHSFRIISGSRGYISCMQPANQMGSTLALKNHLL